MVEVVTPSDNRGTDIAQIMPKIAIANKKSVNVNATSLSCMNSKSEQGEESF